MSDRIRACVFCGSLLLLAWSLVSRSWAGETGENFGHGIQNGLAKRYPGARIEISPAIRWTRGQPPERITSVALFEETGRGEVRLRAEGESVDPSTGVSHPTSSEGLATFSAFVPAWIANRRVFPNEKLDPSAFSEQEVNVAYGPYRDIRGLLISAKPPAIGQEEDSGDLALSSLQSRQTILEGGALLSSAVERIPDVRRGDSIRINLVANGLVLTVPGTAQEPAYLNGRIRVMTERTKRELVGELESGGVVEVHL